ncbi:MAG: hypothetical protein NC433_16405 [Clostridiales bacterium]|nr:hypothetical protein [Clostridiales bacterium]
MKANKVAVISSLVLDIVIGNILYWADIPKVIYDILIGIFTGLIVSLVAGIVGYYVERTKIRSKLQTVIPDTYFNLTVIHAIIGGILPWIIYTENLSKLNYNMSISMADIALKSIGKEELNTYSGFFKYGKLNSAVCKMKSFETKVFNLKNCLNNVLINALNADNLQLEKQTIMPGMFFPPEKEKLITDTRNCVNIQTAKIHEYGASLINEMDDIATLFFGKNKWEEQKGYILNQTNTILSNINT